VIDRREGPEFLYDPLKIRERDRKKSINTRHTAWLIAEIHIDVNGKRMNGRLVSC